MEWPAAQQPVREVRGKPRVRRGRCSANPKMLLVPMLMILAI
jgi:hypothetical protein